MTKSITDLKNDLLNTLDSIDKEKLSLPDLQLYASVLKSVSEITEKPYMDTLIQSFGAMGNVRKPGTIAEMKRGDDDGM